MTSPLMKTITNACVQTAVYWGNPQSDGYGGFTYDTPVEISCRWEDKTQLIRSNNGEEVVSKAEVIVLQDVDENGMLYLGTLDDLDSDEESDPVTVDDAFRVLSVEKVSLMQKTDEFIRTVYL